MSKISELSKSNEHINIKAVACHVSSQISDENLILKSLTYIKEIADQLKREGHELNFLDIGGGLGIRYKDEKKEIKNFNFRS